MRLGEFIAQDMVSARLSPPARTVVIASPDYLQRHGTPSGDSLNSVTMTRGLR